MLVASRKDDCTGTRFARACPRSRVVAAISHSSVVRSIQLLLFFVPCPVTATTKKKQKPAHPWKSWLSVRCMSKGASGHIHRVPPMLQKCPERRSYCRIPNWTERRWPLWRVALTRLYQLGPTAACPPLTVRSRPSNLLTWPQNARLPPTTAYPCPNSLRRGLSASSKPTLPLRMLSLFDTFHWFSMVFMGNGKN